VSRSRARVVRSTAVVAVRSFAITTAPGWTGMRRLAAQAPGRQRRDPDAADAPAHAAAHLRHHHARRRRQPPRPTPQLHPGRLHGLRKRNARQHAWLRSRLSAPDVRDFRRHVAGAACRDVGENRHRLWISLAGGAGGSSGARSPSVQTIMKRPGRESADLADVRTQRREGGQPPRAVIRSLSSPSPARAKLRLHPSPRATKPPLVLLRWPSCAT
jgi:hypothetical protein